MKIKNKRSEKKECKRRFKIYGYIATNMQADTLNIYLKEKKYKPKHNENIIRHQQVKAKRAFLVWSNTHLYWTQRKVTHSSNLYLFVFTPFIDIVMVLYFSSHISSSCIYIIFALRLYYTYHTYGEYYESNLKRDTFLPTRLFTFGTVACQTL